MYPAERRARQRDAMGQRERGNDNHGNIQTISDIQAHYRQEGLQFKKVINECRDYSKSVPIYENPIGTESQTAQALSLIHI